MSAPRELLVETPAGVRRALVRAPASPTGGLRPLVVLLHGAGGTAALALGNTRWAALADREGILLACPEGTRPDPAAPAVFRLNPQSWNDGSGRGHTARAGVDDVGFLDALLTDLVRDHGADPGRMYLVGFSNGGSLAFRAAVELAPRVAAIGPVAGHCWAAPEPGQRAVPALMMFGGQDLLNPPDGGEVKTPWGSVEYHPPIRESFDRWRTFNGCTGVPLERSSAEGVQEWSATECAPGGEVRCLVIEDLGHHWPGGPRLLPPWIAGPASQRVDGTRTLWEFLRRHRLS